MEYPRTVTTADGLMMQFDTHIEHVRAYEANPVMFMEKPVPPEVPIVGVDVDVASRESQPMAVSIAKSYVPPRRRPGRPPRNG